VSACALTCSPPTSYLPVIPHSLLLLLQNQLYHTLIDTGADISFIDIEVVRSLDIFISPSRYIVEFASISHQQPSLGVTAPLRVTPILVQDSLISQNQLKPHAFEILDLSRDVYQFIIGRDLIPLIFGAQIPTSIACRHSPSPHVLLAAVTSHILEPPTVSIINTSSAHYTPSEIQGLIDPLEGQGYIPFEEQPTRVMTSTPADLEQEYNVQRNNILSMPHIAAALQHNEGITGFCNIPEAILSIKLDPKLNNSAYLNIRQYPLSRAAITAATPVIQRWLDTGKITLAPPGCPYNNPLTIAPKKDYTGKLTGYRVCLDVRRLNTAFIDVDRFQIPLIREVLNSLQGCTIFGEFDLAEAYLQFPLHPDSQPYTAFTWGKQQLMFTGCPFGLSQMPSHFQRVMQYVCSDIAATFPYFDNIPFASNTWEEHATHTYAILDTCNNFNLRIKPSSVKIGQAQLNCLGHLLTADGIAISPPKLIAIQEWPLPRNGKQLASFLGLITFVRQHVRHFSDLTAEFDTLKRCKGDIEWTSTRIDQFNLIRKAIAHAPLLHFPDFNKPFYLATDASCVGIGGVLYQPSEEDKEDIHSHNIVAICSKKLNETQRRYSTYKKELWAIVYCLRQFHVYIWGQKLVIITDHMPLTYILTSVQLAHALQQWLDVILDYQFTIKHRPGILHVLPDALSRMYEACYTSAWGVPAKDPHEIIQQHNLNIDKDIFMSIIQPPPLVDSKRSITHLRSIKVNSASQGNDMKIELTVSDDEDSESETEVEYKHIKRDPVSYDAKGLPYNEHLYIGLSTQPNGGLGLFANKEYRSGDHICYYGGELIDIDEFWERYPNQRDAQYVAFIGGRWYRDAAKDFASFGRYANTIPRSNASQCADIRQRTMRLVANRTIQPREEIFLGYGIGNRRAHGNTASVSDALLAPNMEEKYNEEISLSDSDTKLIRIEPSQASPQRSQDDKELRLLVELERRGKVAPLSAKERLQLIDKEHMRGHFGRESIYLTLYRAGYWWPNMRNDIQERIRQCIDCLRFNISKTGFEPATPITAALPFDHIQIDHIILIKSNDGMTAILVLVDVCTGFVLLRPVPDITAEVIASVLWKLFNDFGFPKILQTDNGPEFTSHVVHEITRLSGVDHRYITPYQPRTDGKVERNVGTVKSILRKHLHGVKEDWPAFVPWAQSSINNKITQLTGSTPFSLMFGRRFNPYQDYSSSAPLETMNETDWASLQDQMIAVVYPAVAERVALQKGTMVQRLDRRTRAVNYRKGDIVMLRRHEAVMGEPLGTFEAQYVGPYMVQSKNRTGAITLVTSTGTPLPRLVRPNQLKFVSHFSKEFQQDVYEVERILNHRGEGDNREYLIRWKGYGSKDDTWEPVSNLFDAEYSIQTYLASQAPTQVARRSQHDYKEDEEKDTSPPTISLSRPSRRK
jgi:transposase InsO family protein